MAWLEMRLRRPALNGASHCPGLEKTPALPWMRSDPSAPLDGLVPIPLNSRWASAHPTAGLWELNQKRHAQRGTQCVALYCCVIEHQASPSTCHCFGGDAESGWIRTCPQAQSKGETHAHGVTPCHSYSHKCTGKAALGVHVWSQEGRSAG